jgi:hypothetical protein
MQIMRPKLKSTMHSDDFREWAPSSFESFLGELDYIISCCEGVDPAPLFRGQINYEWNVDSTFARNCIQHIFNISNYLKLNVKIRQTVAFHRALASLLLLKFGTVCKPSMESFEREKTEDIDSWFELLKNLQQYPEKDYFIKGTFLVDWSRSQDIALYFTVYENKGKTRTISSGHGALWICDSVATGKTLQLKKLGEILSLMSKEEFLNGNRTFPLIFHPQRQTSQRRSADQLPVYIAQMDFRYDLADLWAPYENENKKKVFIKLILNENLKNSASEYLKKKGVTEDLVYPE